VEKKALAYKHCDCFQLLAAMLFLTRPAYGAATCFLSSKQQNYSPFALRKGPLFSKILLPFWKQLYFKMTGVRIKISRETGPYGRGTSELVLGCS